MKALEKYTRKRFKNLDKLLAVFPQKNEKESFHKIRLEIKKIKAILGLIRFHDKQFRAHKHYIPFRTLFRVTGKLREAGLQQELMEQYTRIHTPFYRSPSSDIGKFKKAIPKLIKPIRKHEKIILKQITGIKRWLYYTYVQRRKGALLKKLMAGYVPADLHRIRKQIKEVIYLTSIEKPLSTEPLLISMAEAIGNWHDKILLIDFLKAEATSNSKTIHDLRTETHHDLKEIKKLTKDYIAKNRIRISRIRNS